MPSSCCVYKCSVTSEKNPDLSFHSLPTEDKLKKAWICRIRRTGFVPSNTSKVCSKHFVEEDFLPLKSDRPAEFQRKRLRKTAVPSVNLRGFLRDERAMQRKSLNSLRAASCISQLEEAKTKNDFAPETELDDIDLPNNGASPSSHEYAERSDSDSELKRLEELVALLQVQLCTSNEKVNDLSREIKHLEGFKFVYKNLCEKDVLGYTGLEKKNFDVLANFLGRFKPYQYWSTSAVTSLAHEDQLLICLMKLKRNLPLFDIANRYRTSRATVANLYMTYLHVLHETIFKQFMNRLPSIEKTKAAYQVRSETFLTVV